MKTKTTQFLGFLIVISILFFTSCEKYESPYAQQEKLRLENERNQVDTTDWHDKYDNGGSLTNDIDNTNELLGTKWVLTEYRVGFGPIQHPYDTIYFRTSNTYNVNDGGARSYTLSSLPSSTNKELTLNYFFTFGGSHYSGQIGGTFIEDWQMNNVLFTDLQNNGIQVQAFFERIQ